MTVEITVEPVHFSVKEINAGEQERGKVEFGASELSDTAENHRKILRILPGEFSGFTCRHAVADRFLAVKPCKRVELRHTVSAHLKGNAERGRCCAGILLRILTVPVLIDSLLFFFQIRSAALAELSVAGVAVKANRADDCLKILKAFLMGRFLFFGEKALKREVFRMLVLIEAVAVLFITFPVMGSAAFRTNDDVLAVLKGLMAHRTGVLCKIHIFLHIIYTILLYQRFSINATKY